MQITLCIFQVDDLNVEISTLQERLRASLVNRTRVNFLEKKMQRNVFFLIGQTVNDCARTLSDERLLFATLTLFIDIPNVICRI